MKAFFLWPFKNKIEASLWLLFLFFCSGLGYFQGLHPEFKISESLFAPPTIRIFSTAENFFPASVIAELERETRTHIHFELIHSWEELKVQLIAQPTSPDLLLIPSYWAQSLHQEGLLRDADLQDELHDFLAPDFILPQGTDLTPASSGFFATYWSKLFLLKNPESEASLVRMPGKKEAGLSVRFLNDADLLIGYFSALQKKALAHPLLKAQFSIFNFDQWAEQASTSSDFVLLTHVQQRQLPLFEKIDLPEMMMIFGFALPKNGNHRRSILKIIKHYVSFEIQSQLLLQLPMASTLNSVNESSLPVERKSSFLRELGMDQMTIIREKEKGSEEKAHELSHAAFSL